MQIQFMLNGTVVKATLENTPATRDLVAMLPLTVTLEDYASTEKIAYLKQPLSREGAPEGVEPRAGDVTYPGLCTRRGVSGPEIMENQRLAGKVKSDSGAFFSGKGHVSGIK